MASMLQPNVALLTQRQVKGEGWGHAWVTDHVVGKFALSSKSSNVCYAFPLYVYDEGSAEVGLHQLRRSPNISTGILKSVSEGLGRDVSPEDMLGYVYAILLSPGYRSTYRHLLQQGFPRIPFTKDRDIFLKLAEMGQQLIDLHLMHSPELDKPISRFCGKGDSTVRKIEYDADRGRVTINSTQYFDGVIPDLWSYQIGGYRVLSKWLKDRKGRFLTSADTQHYSRVVTALARTIAIQAQIDANMENVLKSE
jgi:predicted helicase